MHVSFCEHTLDGKTSVRFRASVMCEGKCVCSSPAPHKAQAAQTVSYFYTKTASFRILALKSTRRWRSRHLLRQYTGMCAFRKTARIRQNNQRSMWVNQKPKFSRQKRVGVKSKTRLYATDWHRLLRRLRWWNPYLKANSISRGLPTRIPLFCSALRLLNQPRPPAPPPSEWKN